MTIELLRWWHLFSFVRNVFIQIINNMRCCISEANDIWSLTKFSEAMYSLSWSFRFCFMVFWVYVFTFTWIIHFITNLFHFHYFLLSNCIVCWSHLSCLNLQVFLPLWFCSFKIKFVIQYRWLIFCYFLSDQGLYPTRISPLLNMLNHNRSKC